MAIIGGAIFALFLLGGFIFAPVADGGIIVNGTMPIFAAIFTWFIFGEGIGHWRIAGISLIVVGVAATGWDALEFGAPGQWKGHLLFLGAAAFNSAFLTAVRGWKIGALQSLVAVMGLNSLIYLPIWWLFLPSNIITRNLSGNSGRLRGGFYDSLRRPNNRIDAPSSNYVWSSFLSASFSNSLARRNT